MENTKAENAIIDTLIQAAVEKNVLDEIEKLEAEAEMKPHVFSSKFENAATKTIYNYKKKQAIKKFGNVLPKAAAVFLIITVSVTGIGGFSVQAFKERFFRMIENFGTEFFMLLPSETEIVEPMQIQEKLLSVLPDGYAITKERTGINTSTWEFENGEGDYVELKVDSLDSKQWNLMNNELIEYEKFPVNNRDAYIMSRTDSYSTLVWYDSENVYKINTSLNKEQLMDIYGHFSK